MIEKEGEMVKRIAGKEFKEMLRDGRFRWASAIVFALLLASMVMGAKHHREVRRQHDLAQAETRDQWLRQPAKNPHSAAHYGIYAFKPKMLPAMLDRGVDPFTGQAVWLEAHKQNEFKFRPAQDSTAVQRFGELTAATVMQLLIPLLIVLLSFSAFAGEREQGTLRQLLSLGVKKTDLAWGKALGIAGALGALIVPATAIGVVALGLASENGLMAASASRMAVMFASYLLYFGVFIGVSLAVSARAPSSRLALVTLLAFWILNGLIAPRAAADIARRAYPTPSAFAFQQSIDHEMQGGPDGHDTADKRAEALKQRVLKQYGVDKIEALPVSFAGVSLQEGEEHGNVIFDKHYTALWNQFERQNRLKQMAAFFAPMLAINSLSMGLAGTDFAQHRDFAAAAEQYRRMLVKMMNDDMTYNAGKSDFSYLAQPAVWQKVPDFEYAAPSTAWALRHQTISLAMLALWFVAATAAALGATGKMRVD
jgi:ABC-2 type transport system permease protein